MYFVYYILSHYDAAASSVLNITSVFPNPNATMTLHDVVVTCDINPTSTAEFCEVFARNDDASLSGMLHMYIYVCTYINSFV